MGEVISDFEFPEVSACVSEQGIILNARIKTAMMDAKNFIARKGKIYIPE